MSDLNTTFVDLPSETTPIDSAWLNAANKRMRSRLPVIDVVEDHGAAVDGATDDTAAWQAALTAAATAGGARIICSKRGVSVIAGALTDTGASNCQLKLPAVDYVDTENITIVIEGALPPPNVFSVIGSTPLPDNHLVLKSTLTSGSGGAMIGARGPGGTFGGFTNVTLRIENVGFRMPADPTHTALDLRSVACVDLDNVVVDAGNYYCEGISAPATTTSFAIRLPGNDNGAHVRLGQVDAIGFYNGFEFAEHAIGQSVSAWACRKAFTFLASNHASSFQRLMTVHCQRGIVGSGTHYLEVDQFDIEHAASGTWVTTYDVDDASNVLHGSARWHVVLANVGIDATFTKNSGTAFNTSRVGTAATGGSALTVQDENANVSTAVTQIDFQGAGVTTTAGTGEVIVTIPGGGAGATTYVARDRLVAAAGNTKLTLGASPVANSPLVWVNNTIKWPTTDYTISGNVITFNSALSASDVVLVQYHTTNAAPGASALSTPTPVGVSFHTTTDVSTGTNSTNTSAINLGNRFTFPTAGTITSLRVYANVAGTYKARLYDNAGAVLATPASSVTVSGAGWIDFPVSYAVAAGTANLWVVGFFPAGQWKNLELGTPTRNGIQFLASGYVSGSDIAMPTTPSTPSYFTDVVIAQ